MEKIYPHSNTIYVYPVLLLVHSLNVTYVLCSSELCDVDQPDFARHAPPHLSVLYTGEQ